MADSVEEGVLSKIHAVCGKMPSLTDTLAMLDIDSMRMAELTFDLERHFGIRMDDTIVDLETVGEIIEYVRQRVK